MTTRLKLKLICLFTSLAATPGQMPAQYLATNWRVRPF
jgi:hypothetical protein